MSLPSWARLVLLVALAKVLVGLVVFVRDPPPDRAEYPSIFYFLFMVSFGAGAALLLAGGREDRRAVALGGFLLVGATAFADGPIEWALRTRGSWADLLTVLFALRPDMFLAYFLW